MLSIITFIRRFFVRLDRGIERIRTEWNHRANMRSILIVLLIASAVVYCYTAMIAPPDDFPVRTLITVPSGSSSDQIAHSLVEQHVIRSAMAFEIAEILSGASNSLRAGDYMFKTPQNILAIAHIVATGAYGLEPIHITVPDGSTVKDMATLFAAQLPRFDASAFLAEAQPQEGYLFPDTYYFLPNVTEHTVVETMRQNFDQRIATLVPPIASSTYSLSDIVIMASIVEKEANTDHDRRMVAGVLWNRIAKNMPLQSDIPIMYVTGKYDSQLTMADLHNPSPYNTYVHAGLPIGPVDNPSLNAIDAAAFPIKNNYLFYLSDKSDTTYYATTYAGHMRNKALYMDHVTLATTTHATSSSQ